MKGKESHEECFTCRGIELLEPDSSGKCPSAMFGHDDKKGSVKAWMRVCKYHETVTLPKERVAYVVIPKIANIDLEEAQKIVLFILKSVNDYALKHDLIARSSNNEKSGIVQLSGEVYVVCRDGLSCISLCDQLNRDSRDGLVARVHTRDTQWIKCNAHKHLCVEANFLEKKRSSCTAGWMKHRARSTKTRKPSKSSNVADTFDDDDEGGEEEEEVVYKAPKRGRKVQEKIHAAPVAVTGHSFEALGKRPRNNSALSTSSAPATALYVDPKSMSKPLSVKVGGERADIVRELMIKLRFIRETIARVNLASFGNDVGTANGYCNKWERILCRLNYLASTRVTGWVVKIKAYVDMFNISSFSIIEDTNFLDNDGFSALAYALSAKADSLRITSAEDCLRWVASALAVTSNILGHVINAMESETASKPPVVTPGTDFLYSDFDLSLDSFVGLMSPFTSAPSSPLAFQMMNNGYPFTPMASASHYSTGLHSMPPFNPSNSPVFRKELSLDAYHKLYEGLEAIELPSSNKRPRLDIPSVFSPNVSSINTASHSHSNSTLPSNGNSPFSHYLNTALSPCISPFHNYSPLNTFTMVDSSGKSNSNIKAEDWLSLLASPLAAKRI